MNAAQEHVEELTDAELLAAFNTAKSDLAEAAETQRNSEWHQACFAAVFLFATAMSERGLKAETVHGV